MQCNYIWPTDGILKCGPLFQDIQLRGAIFFFCEQTFLTTGDSTADVKVNDPVFEVGGDIYTYTQRIFTSEHTRRIFTANTTSP